MPDPVLNNAAAFSRATAWRAYLADEGASFLPLFALFIPVMLLALGSAVDYVSATRREDTINGIADAAALVATTPQAMNTYHCIPDGSACPDLVAQMTAAFQVQLSQVQGVGTVTPTIGVVDTSTTPTMRTATVTWTSTSNNAFGGILGFGTIAIGGESVAKNSNAPVTTFYMLIDNSPSMAFPAQSSGVTTMEGATPNESPQPDCALACHESSTTGYGTFHNPSNVSCVTFPVSLPASQADPFTAGNAAFGCVDSTKSIVLPVGLTSEKVKSTTYTCDAGASNAQTVGNAGFINTKYYGAEDSFALSRCLGVELRVDEVNDAVSSLMSTAPTTATENNTTYAVQIYSLDHGDNNTADTYTTIAPAHTPSIAVVGLYPIYYWGCASASPTCASPDSPATIEAQTNSTMTTDFDTAGTVATADLLPLETCSPGSTLCGSTAWADGVPGYYQTSSSQDDDSYIDKYGLAGMYALMPTPGNGGSKSTPEEVLFLVTDGMNDAAGSGPTYGCNGVNTNSGGSTPYGSTQGPGPYYSRNLFCANQTNQGTGKDYCTEIKARGIRIAYLYLRYNGLNPYDYYSSAIEPWQYPGDTSTTSNVFTGYTDEIEQAAIACASTGLEFTVDTDDNISTAMTTLFQKAVQTAYLAH